MDPAVTLRNTFHNLSHSIRTNFNVFPINPNIDNYPENYYLIEIADEISFCQYVIELNDLRIGSIISHVLQKNEGLNLSFNEIIICHGNYKIYSDDELSMFYDMSCKKGEISLKVTALMLSTYENLINITELNDHGNKNEAETTEVMNDSVISETTKDLVKDLTFDVKPTSETPVKGLIESVDLIDINTIESTSTIAPEDENNITTLKLSANNDKNKCSQLLLFQRDLCHSFVWTENEEIGNTFDLNFLQFDVSFRLINVSNTIWLREHLHILPRESASFENVDFYLDHCDFDIKEAVLEQRGRNFLCNTRVTLKKESVQTILQSLNETEEKIANIEWNLYIRNSWPMQLLSAPLVTSIVLCKNDTGLYFINGQSYTDVGDIEQNKGTFIETASPQSELEFILPRSPSPKEQQLATKEWIMDSPSIVGEKDASSFVVIDELYDGVLSDENDNVSFVKSIGSMVKSFIEKEEELPEKIIVDEPCPVNVVEINHVTNDNIKTEVVNRGSSVNLSQDLNLRGNGYQYENSFTLSMNSLFLMGFFDRSLNTTLLNKHDCDIEKVVDELTNSMN